MQATVDNRMAQAELLIQMLEAAGYRFKVVNRRGKDQYWWQLTPGAEPGWHTSEMLLQLQQYRGEVCQYITARAKKNLSRIKMELGGSNSV